MPSITRFQAFLFAVVLVNAAPAEAQQGWHRRNQISLDIGPLEGGLAYARRLGQGSWSVGGGVWAGWEPWNSFETSFFEPRGVHLFLRTRPSREVQLELGPSLLRYNWADDCSSCSGTFASVRAAAMVGRGIFSLGPVLQLGRLSGSPAGAEAGLVWGFQGRLLFSWGD
ncbi:MAG TPA: hypothetical protein VH680_17695 [Gemmatimonadales bacterium]|jgi:hypothetical protein